MPSPPTSSPRPSIRFSPCPPCSRGHPHSLRQRQSLPLHCFSLHSLQAYPGVPGSKSPPSTQLPLPSPGFHPLLFFHFLQAPQSTHLLSLAPSPPMHFLTFLVCFPKVTRGQQNPQILFSIPFNPYVAADAVDYVLLWKHFSTELGETA